jgi:hypothetical protein
MVKSTFIPPVAFSAAEVLSSIATASCAETKTEMMDNTNKNRIFFIRLSFLIL